MSNTPYQARVEHHWYAGHSFDIWHLTVQLSFLLRMGLLFIILFALIKSGLCNSLAAVLPLVFTRPILFVGEFFRKSGESNT